MHAQSSLQAHQATTLSPLTMAGQSGHISAAAGIAASRVATAMAAAAGAQLARGTPQSRRAWTHTERAEVRPPWAAGIIIRQLGTVSASTSAAICRQQSIHLPCEGMRTPAACYSGPARKG